MKNKIESIAKLFDLELGEEFNIEGHEQTFVFTTYGLQIKCKDISYAANFDIWNDIIMGKTKVIKKQYKPNIGDGYWAIIDKECAELYVWQDFAIDKEHFIMGNIFKNARDAKNNTESFLEKLNKSYDKKVNEYVANRSV